MGTQEVNICDVVKSTKYTKFISKKRVFTELYKAIKISKEGGQGLFGLMLRDIQWADIEYKKSNFRKKKNSSRRNQKYNQILKYLDESGKP